MKALRTPGIILLLTFVTSAQAPDPKTAPTLVRLTLTARYANGEPVMDLSSTALSVTDQDKPRKIVFFRSNRRGASSPPGSNEYSNHSFPETRSTVVLFDLLNEHPSERLAAWRSLRRAFSQIKPGEVPYLYLLTMEGNLAPVRAIGSKSGQTLDKAALDSAMESGGRAPPASMNWDEVVTKTYHALESLSEQLAALPGEKEIIWITSQIPRISKPKVPCKGDWAECALYLPELSTALNRAGVNLDPLSYSTNRDLRRDMDLMAGLTGGRAFYADDISSVLKQLARDAADSYSLAYDVPAATVDGTFHRIRVTTARAGIQVHAQQRYYAAPDPRPASGREQAALRIAYQSPVDLPEIGLRVTIAQRTPKTVRFQILIQASDLLIREDGDNFSARLALGFTDLGSHVPLSEPSVSRFDVRLTREQRDILVQSGIFIAPEHQVADGTQKVRIFVLDQATGAVGSITVPIGAAGT